MTEKQDKKQSKGRQVVSLLLKYGVPLLISVGLCYLLFTGVNFNEMIELIKRDCNFWWIGLAWFIAIFSHIFRAMRWRIQLRALGINPPLFVVVLSIFGTYAVNLVLPRLGELWRTGWISQRQDAPFDKVFGSMVADRLADTVLVALLTGFTFIVAHSQLLNYLSQNAEGFDRMIDLASSPWLWAGAAACVGLLVMIFVKFPNNKLVSKVKEFCIGLWRGFAVIARMKGKGAWLLLSAAIWSCYFMQLYVAFFSFPATTEVVNIYGISAVLVCFVLTSISMGVPSNGGIGPWQWAMIFGLSMYSAGIPEMNESYAGSFANLVMGSQTLLLIILGLFTFIAIAVMKRRQNRRTLNA